MVIPVIQQGVTMKMRAYSLLAAASVLSMFSTGAAALGNLENPQPGGIEAGISAITGWHCTSKNIEVRIDGNSAGLAGAGTLRGDTASICGGRTDTGFSYLFNYSLLQGGTHKVDVYADGAIFGSATFQVGYLGGEFLTGLSAAHRVPDFPVRGQGARLVWEQSKQNFVIAGMEALTSGSLIGTYTIRNVWLQDSTGVSVSTLATGVTVSGTWTFRTDGTYSGTFVLAANGQTQTESFSGTYTDGGYYLNDSGAIDLVIERGDTLTLLNLSKDSTSSTAIVISATRNLSSAAIEADAAGMAIPAPSGGGVLHTIAEALRPMR